MPVTQVSNIVRVTYVYALVLSSVTVDQAQLSVCYHVGTLPAPGAATEAFLNEMAGVVLASHKARIPTSQYASSVVLDHVRVALEGTDGRTISEGRLPADSPNDWVGSGTAASLPWSDSLVLSLYAYTPGSFDALARQKRGRIYLPPPAAGLLLNNGSGLLNASVCADIMAAWALHLKDVLNTVYTTSSASITVPVVNSRKGVAAHAITALRIDDKVDSQMRRLNREAALVAVADFPPP